MRQVELLHAGLARGVPRGVGQAGAQADGQAGQPVIEAEDARPGLLTVEPVVGRRQRVDAGAVVVQRRAQVQRGLHVEQAGQQFTGTALDFELQPGRPRLAEIDRRGHVARHAGVRHRLQAGDVADEVVHIAAEASDAEHAAALQVALKGDVDAGGQFGLEAGVAAAVGRGFGVGPGGVDEQRAQRRTRQQRAQLRRLVAARQAGADHVAALGVELVIQVPQRRGHLAVVAHLGHGAAAPGGDALAAQPQVGGPLRGDLPFVLYEQGLAGDARREGLAFEFGQLRTAVFCDGARLVALALLQVPARGERVFVTDELAVLARLREVAVLVVALDAALRRRHTVEGALAGPAGELEFDLLVVAEAVVPLQVAAHVLPGAGEGVVGLQAGLAGNDLVAKGGEVVPLAALQEGLGRGRLVVADLPVHTRCGIEAVAPVVGATGLHDARRPAVQARSLPVDHAVVDVAPAEQRHGQRQAQTARTFAVSEVQRRRGPHGVVAQAQAQVALRDAGRVLQDDVDGAGHGLGTLVGGGAARHLHAFDLARAQLVELEARRRRVAVNEDQRVARAQAAHARRAALHVHARQALEHIRDAGVAVLVQFLAPVHLLGHRRAAAQLGVGLRAGRDLHPVQPRARRTLRAIPRQSGHVLRHGGSGEKGHEQRQAGGEYAVMCHCWFRAAR